MKKQVIACDCCGAVVEDGATIVGLVNRIEKGVETSDKILGGVKPKKGELNRWDYCKRCILTKFSGETMRKSPVV